MLQEDNLLVDRLWIVKEVEVRDLVGDALSGLTSACTGSLSAALLWPLNVVEVEVVWMQDYLGGVIEVHPVRAIAQHVPQSVLSGEVYKLGDEFGAWLLLGLLG